MISPIDTASSGPWATAASPGRTARSGFHPTRSTAADRCRTGRRTPRGVLRRRRRGRRWRARRDRYRPGCGRKRIDHPTTRPRPDGLATRHHPHTPPRRPVRARMVLDVLADGDAEAALGNEQIRRTTPSRRRGSCRWRSGGRATNGRQRVDIGASSFEVGQRAPDRPEPLDCAHALLPPCRASPGRGRGDGRSTRPSWLG